MTNLSQEFFQGFFDTDGTIQVYLVNRQKKSVSPAQKLKIPLGVEITFSITQSKSKSDILDVLQKQYGGYLFERTRISGTKEVVYKSYLSSVSGQKIRKTLTAYLPLHPSRRQDFLIALHIRNLLDKKVQATKQGQICIVELAYRLSNESGRSSSFQKRQPIQNWYDLIKPNSREKAVGQNQAEIFYNSVVKVEKSKLFKNLPTTQLSKDYMLGAHCGDGSLFITIMWDPTKSYVNRPTWSMTDYCKPYLQAFQHTIGKGKVKHSGLIKGNCFKFVIENTQACLKHVIPLFEDAWLPFYKKQQFQKFKQACCMLCCNYLNSQANFEIFLNLVYNMSENSKRKYTKEQFQKWASERLQTRSRVLKQKEDLYKKLMGSSF